MRLALMIEGQEGVSWEDWLALARACEEHGVEALFRSDHYLSPTDPSRAALDAWAVLPALAAQTSGLELGTLVSPVTFAPRRCSRTSPRPRMRSPRVASRSGWERAGWMPSTRRSASRSPS